MQGLGQRLRERARELGIADATVAERLGLSQQRYHRYISDQTEPDFRTLIRICEALATEPNVVLGFSTTDRESDRNEDANTRARISAAASTMETHILRLAAAIVDALAREAVAAERPATAQRIVHSTKLTPKCD